MSYVLAGYGVTVVTLAAYAWRVARRALALEREGSAWQQQ